MTDTDERTGLQQLLAIRDGSVVHRGRTVATAESRLV
jgi:hypothetical protein